MSVQIQGIEIFSKVDKGKLAQIEALFNAHSFEAGVEITRFGKRRINSRVLDRRLSPV